jgi:hypothetical protein
MTRPEVVIPDDGQAEADCLAAERKSLLAGARLEALEKASAAVAQMTAPVMNSKGYPVDGYRALAHEDRISFVLRTARFLLGEEPES